MTTTLTHPPAEDLGCFIEGTLDDEARAAVVEHLADCDDCRMTMVDALAFDDPAAFDEDPIVKPRPASGRWWAAAAAAIAIAVGGMWLVDARSDPEAPLIEASVGLPSRQVEARLNGFQYVGLHRMRGGDQETGTATFRLEGEVQKVLELHGNSAKTLHARGVAHLLAAGLKKVDPQASDAQRQEDAAEIKSERAKAIESLSAAVGGAPNNVKYQSDLAAALIETGDSENLKLAVGACDQAINIDPGSREALFNRAIALRNLRDERATAAFRNYLKVDPSSPWAEEAKQQIDLLK